MNFGGRKLLAALIGILRRGILTMSGVRIFHREAKRSNIPQTLMSTLKVPYRAASSSTFQYSLESSQMQNTGKSRVSTTMDGNSIALPECNFEGGPICELK